MNFPERLSREQIDAMPRYKYIKYESIVRKAEYMLVRWHGDDYKRIKIGKELEDYEIHMAIFNHVVMPPSRHDMFHNGMKTNEELLVDHWVAYLKGEIKMRRLGENDPLKKILGDVMVNDDYEYLRDYFRK